MPESRFLVADGIGKAYDGTQALDGAAAGVEDGRRLALLGPRGCGRTTLLRVVAGLETPDAGTARLDEAARTLGASAPRRFVTVDLPLVAPGLLAGAGLVLLSTLKELPATALLAPAGFQTLATRIFGVAEDGFFAEIGVTLLVLLAISTVLTWLLVLRPELGGRQGGGTR